MDNGLIKSRSNEKNLVVLNSLYKNAQMGIQAINSVSSKTNDPTLRNELNTQLNAYRDKAKEIREKMNKEHKRPQGINSMQRMMTKAIVSVQSSLNPSNENIAKMMVKGTNMGTMKLNHELNNAKNLDTDIKNIATDMLEKEEKYINKLTSYL